MTNQPKHDNHLSKLRRYKLEPVFFCIFCIIFAYKSRTTQYLWQLIVPQERRLQDLSEHYRFNKKIKITRSKIDFFGPLDRFFHFFSKNRPGRGLVWLNQVFWGNKHVPFLCSWFISHYWMRYRVLKFVFGAPLFLDTQALCVSVCSRQK